MPSYPKITWNDMQMCIDALKYQAKNEAGQTQAPMLQKQEDYPQWQLAKRMQDRLDTHRAVHPPMKRKRAW